MKMGSCLFPHKVTKVFKGRHDFVGRQRHVSFSTYGAWYLPKFQFSHLVQVVCTLIPSFVFFRLLDVDSLLATGKSSSWEWTLTSLENTLPVS